MHTKIKYLLFFVLITVSVKAQKSLIIYHINGSVNLVAGNLPTGQAGNTSVAKRGDVISKNTSLQVKPGADCMLIEEKGKSLNVTAGTYSFEVLQKKLSANTAPGVTQKFFSYVYSNMFSGKKEDKLSITPVVFRGDDLMKLPADNTIIISDAFTLGWKKPAGKIPVRLFVSSDKDGEVMDTVLKTSTSLQVSIVNNNLLAGNVYKWKTEESGARHKERYFHFLIAEKNDRKEILKDLKLLQNKNLANELKVQIQQDIFQKWSAYYLKRS